MLFSQALQESIHRQFMDTQSTLGLCGEKIIACLRDCGEDERVAMEFFYSTMPAGDIGDYDFSLYRKYAEFGLFLAENSLWNSKIPEDIFLNYVLHYRINNEAIEDCRAFFYHALLERIKGKNMMEAALEVNVWCAEHVSYQATDERTASPLAVLKSSYGRCGEESTLVVTAMRSVGIPARQVYTPRWAHCDDNHAWVEVWCDGEWYFLGACEPEPVLNRGWFNGAAARAMLVDSRSFLPIKGEETITNNGQTTILNELSRYAPARLFTVSVMKDAEPAAGVDVRFELLNGSEFSPLASVITDEKGKAAMTLGLGSIHIHAVKNGLFAEAFADTEETDFVAIDFSKAIRAESDIEEDFNFRAPKDSTRNLIQLTDEQKDIRGRIISDADRKRKEYAKSFYRKEEAEKLAEQFCCPDKVIEILKAAEGNFQEIYDFLSMDFGLEKKELQLQMLQSLVKKDYRDVRCDVLEEHFKSSLCFEKDYDSEIFVPYILCPRVHYEQLLTYRELLSSYFDEQTAADFRKCPKRVWEYVSGFQSAPARQNERLAGTPAGIIRSEQAGVTSRKILFTAVCRTLGIPARINPIDFAAQYYQDGGFQNAEDVPEDNTGTATLTLLAGEEEWSYLHNWTIAVLKDGIYQSLELTDYPWAGERLQLSLTPGNYRLITSSRMPNGNQFAKKYCFRLSKGEAKVLAISLRQTQIADLLEDIPFAPFKIYNDHREAFSVDTMDGDKTRVFAWLEEGCEPTEHLLNEFIEAQGALNAMNCEIIFIIRDHTAFNNETFSKACKAIHSVQVYYCDFYETAETMARRMYVDPESLPLTVVTRKNRGIYACSGYNVGIVNLLIEIFHASNEGA